MFLGTPLTRTVPDSKPLALSASARISASVRGSLIAGMFISSYLSHTDSLLHQRRSLEIACNGCGTAHGGRLRKCSSHCTAPARASQGPPRVQRTEKSLRAPLFSWVPSLPSLALFFYSLGQPRPALH